MLTVYKMTITSVNLLAAADEMSDSVEFCEHHSNLAAGTAALLAAAEAIAPESAWSPYLCRAWGGAGQQNGMSVTVGDTQYLAERLEISVI